MDPIFPSHSEPRSTERSSVPKLHQQRQFYLFRTANEFYLWQWYYNNTTHKYTNQRKLHTMQKENNTQNYTNNEGHITSNEYNAAIAKLTLTLLQALEVL
jgi:hypothetical protein